MSSHTAHSNTSKSHQGMLRQCLSTEAWPASLQYVGAEAWLFSTNKAASFENSSTVSPTDIWAAIRDSPQIYIWENPLEMNRLEI